MRRIILLLQALTCLTVITVNGIVLYQFLNRAGCTTFKLDFTNPDKVKQNATGFEECVMRAVNQREFPKKQILPVEQSPSGEQSPGTRPASEGIKKI